MLDAAGELRGLPPLRGYHRARRWVGCLWTTTGTLIREPAAQTARQGPGGTPLSGQNVPKTPRRSCVDYHWTLNFQVRTLNLHHSLDWTLVSGSTNPWASSRSSRVPPVQYSWKMLFASR